MGLIFYVSNIIMIVLHTYTIYSWYNLLTFGNIEFIRMLKDCYTRPLTLLHYARPLTCQTTPSNNILHYA